MWNTTGLRVEKKPRAIGLDSGMSWYVYDIGGVIGEVWRFNTYD